MTIENAVPSLSNLTLRPQYKTFLPHRMVALGTTKSIPQASGCGIQESNAIIMKPLAVPIITIQCQFHCTATQKL